jgi:hypothetical protein
MAGNLDDNDQRKEVGQKVADAKVQRLNEVIGTPWWQGAWSNKGMTTNERIDAIATLYENQVRDRGFDSCTRSACETITSTVRSTGWFSARGQGTASS